MTTAAETNSNVRLLLPVACSRMFLVAEIVLIANCAPSRGNVRLLAPASTGTSTGTEAGADAGTSAGAGEGEGEGESSGVGAAVGASLGVGVGVKAEAWSGHVTATVITRHDHWCERARFSA